MKLIGIKRVKSDILIIRIILFQGSYKKFNEMKEKLYLAVKEDFPSESNTWRKNLEKEFEIRII